FTRLAKEDPVKFLDACLRRYNRETHGYSGVLHKQERIAGKLHPPEVVDFWFREEPYSVLMKWKQGAKMACGTLYVEGENDNNALVLPTLLKWSGKLVEHDPEGRMAKDCSRYTIREFSIRQGTERAYKAWKAAQERGALVVEYK